MQIIYGRVKYDHVTPFLTDQLHWLLFPQSALQMILWMYKALNGLVPSYISSYCTSVVEVQRCSTLRSATHGNLTVPRSKTKFGDRSFSVAGPSAWNSLPDNVKSATSVGISGNFLRLVCFAIRTTLEILCMLRALAFGNVYAFGAIQVI